MISTHQPSTCFAKNKSALCFTYVLWSCVICEYLFAFHFSFCTRNAWKYTNFFRWPANELKYILISLAVTTVNTNACNISVEWKWMKIYWIRKFILEKYCTIVMQRNLLNIDLKYAENAIEAMIFRTSLLQACWLKFV